MRDTDDLDAALSRHLDVMADRVDVGDGDLDGIPRRAGRQRRRRAARRGGAALAGVVLLAGAFTVVSGDGRTSDVATGDRSGDSDEVEVAPSDRPFCDAFDAAIASGASLDAALDDAPADIAAEASVLRRAENSDEDVAGAEEASRRLMVWTEVHCNPGAARDGAPPADRRFAPPLQQTPEGLQPCLATSLMARPPSDAINIVLHGDTSVDDPYAGEMVGIRWGSDAPYFGDGSHTPVRVRGVDGVAAPIGVFQGVALEELGTVIAWSEDGREVGLYGRGFDLDRAPELIEIADDLVYRDGEYSLPSSALPDGWDVVFRGSSATFGVIFTTSAYDIRYRSTADQTPTGTAGTPPEPGGTLTLSGLVTTPGEFEAFRFFTIGLHREELAGRDAYVGSAWFEGGPYVATWREPDGSTVRIVGLGGDIETIREVARNTRELNRDEWTDIVEATSPSDCYPADRTDDPDVTTPTEVPGPTVDSTSPPPG